MMILRSGTPGLTFVICCCCCCCCCYCAAAQHFWGHRETIHSLPPPPQFAVAKGHNIWKVTHHPPSEVLVLRRQRRPCGGSGGGAHSSWERRRLGTSGSWCNCCWFIWNRESHYWQSPVFSSLTFSFLLYGWCYLDFSILNNLFVTSCLRSSYVYFIHNFIK